MRRSTSLAVSLTVLALTAGCTSLNSQIQATLAKAEPYSDPSKSLPGLEPLANRPVPVIEKINPIAPPKMAASEDLPFPQRLIGEDEARALLQDDNMAQRFLLLRRMAELGLTAPDDAAKRLNANLGALLPASVPVPPAAGLDEAIPPADRMLNAFTELWPRRDTPSGAAPWAFLLDNLLPADPKIREPVLIPDKQTARRALTRADKLKDAGLISREQRNTEKEALEKMLAGAALPETVAPPPEPPPPPPPKKKPGSSGTGSGGGRPMQRLPGGVSGELHVIPSPEEINAPPIPPGFAGQAGVHLLSMGTAAHGEQAWASLTKDHPELAALTYKVVRADLGELGVTHRLIAGPLSPGQAAKLCITLAQRGQVCRPTPFPP